MPVPFAVRSQTDPGTDLGEWTATGDIRIPGKLTAARVEAPVTGIVMDLLAILSTGDVVQIGLPTESGSRLVINADGSMEWGSGTGAGDTTLYRAAASVLATADDFAVTTAGKGLLIKEGANAKMGTAVLNGATPVVVLNSSVTANSRIFLTIQTTTTDPLHSDGVVWVEERTPGTSFTLLAYVDTIGATVAWMMVEPA